MTGNPIAQNGNFDFGQLMKMLQSTSPEQAKQQVEQLIKNDNVSEEQVSAVFSRATEIAKMLGLS